MEHDDAVCHVMHEADFSVEYRCASPFAVAQNGGGFRNKCFELLSTCRLDDGYTLRSADSKARCIGPVHGALAYFDSRDQRLVWEVGAMSFVNWIIDVLESLIPLIQIGMEG